MRVLLLTDMEGVATIEDPRECWPVFPEYWRIGRRKMTDEAVAAASGLLDGGATTVAIRDTHGAGLWSNIFREELPEGATMYVDSGEEQAFDAMFHLGMHARCGTENGYISHTHVPEFRMKVNGALITETHDYGWMLGLPFLGITGDNPLGPELDGSLSGTPFLGVKASTGRTETRPVHDDPNGAIRDFARTCAQNWREAVTPRPPDEFTLEISMRPDLADLVKPETGLQRTADHILALDGTDWRRDARPGIVAARMAALRPWHAAHGDLKVSSEEIMLQQDPASLQRLRDYISGWMETNYSAW